MYILLENELSTRFQMYSRIRLFYVKYSEYVCIITVAIQY